jgi:hypothetical protein
MGLPGGHASGCKARLVVRSHANQPTDVAGQAHGLVELITEMNRWLATSNDRFSPIAGLENLRLWPTADLER